jgi:hypothetical protein
MPGSLFVVLAVFWASRESTHGLAAFGEHWWCPVPRAMIAFGVASLARPRSCECLSQNFFGEVLPSPPLRTPLIKATAPLPMLAALACVLALPVAAHAGTRVDVRRLVLQPADVGAHYTLNRPFSRLRTLGEVSSVRDRPRRFVVES